MGDSIWSILEARACAKRPKPHTNIDALKQSLQQGWDRLLEELQRIALNFWNNLMLCIEAEGAQFKAN